MPKNRFLEKNWGNLHLRKIKQAAKHRYTPELNVTLPISEVFDGISRTEKFYTSIRERYGKLSREFTRARFSYEDKETQKLYQNFCYEVSSVLKLLGKIKDYNAIKIPWETIYRITQKANNILWKLIDRLSEERQNSKNERVDDNSQIRLSAYDKFNQEIHRLNEIEKELRYFKNLSSSTKAKLSNSPFLLLTGPAGNGKTHLLCDLIKSRITGKSISPACLVFGELFTTQEHPLTQVISQLGLKISKKKFLQLLNTAAEQSSCRAIIAIDALNETADSKYWKNNINLLVDAIKSYPHISLIISVRSGFENEVLTKKQRELFINEEHIGFRFREWEAVCKFFKEFNLPLPEIPLLMPEFQRPLFLFLFCKAFQKRNKGRKKQIFRGQEGATYIFETYVDSVSKQLSKDFQISDKPGSNIWDLVIEKIAAEMVKLNDNKISKDCIAKIVKNAYPSVEQNRFIKSLETNMLLDKIPNYSSGRAGHKGFIYRFPFQKFSDHLIGRYIFKQYENGVGKGNKTLENAKLFFSNETNLGQFLEKSWNRGLVEALSIQCPEYLNGIEFVEVAPYLKETPLAQEAFVESLIWRKPSSFSADLKETLNYINLVGNSSWGNSKLLEAFLTVAPIPDHPFNAVFLDKHLTRSPMPKRDSWWSTFLHRQFGENGAVDRLIEWGWSEEEKTHISDESIFLCSLALVWFLASSNRTLRDKSTKALVSLLTNRLNIVLMLLKHFATVDDPYVSERLYAVAYGCSMRSRKDREGLRILSTWIYDNVFKDGTPPLHILIRDYARGIIELALHERIKLTMIVNRIQPPFKSEWPIEAPTEQILREKYYREFSYIWSSVMHEFQSLADFGNYVINSAVRDWSGRKFNGRDIKRRTLFKNFKAGLTSGQKKLLEIPTTTLFFKYISLPEGNINKEEMKDNVKKQDEEIRAAYNAFERSLPADKKMLFNNEIKPFLDDRGNLNDILETFDTGLAQRWVFNRVVELGWQQNLHGAFDEDVRSSTRSRSNHKVERIGKKYQWIAFFELLARLSDHFEFNGERWSDEAVTYEGPWQLHLRDIDPSCLLKEFPNPKPNGFPVLPHYEKQTYYNAWNKHAADSTWLKRNKDLPDPKQLLEFIDDNGHHWINLSCYFQWQPEILPEHKRYDFPNRKLEYAFYPYLTKRTEKENLMQWLQSKIFNLPWMPESHEFYRAYLGEYPWAPAFLYHCIPYFHHDGWTDGQGDEKIPAKILVLDDEYLSSGSSSDYSTNSTIHIKLPAKFIVDEMNLTQSLIDGRFFDEKNELVAFDPSVFDESWPRVLLMSKDKLVRFLKKNDFAIFWTLWGGKNMIGGGVMGQPSGWLEISGTYILNDANEIEGAITTRFKK